MHISFLYNFVCKLMMSNISTSSINFLPLGSRPLDLNLDNLFTVYENIINKSIQGC